MHEIPPQHQQALETVTAHLQLTDPAAQDAADALGVELGQIAALVVMVSLLAVWRRRASFKRFSYVANLGLFYAGVYLLFMQLHGYQHDTAPDSFSFPAAEHRHAHEDMDSENATDASRNDL